MVAKRVSTVVLGALLLACASSAMADEYRADEFFGLDLSNAALSPKRLGPPTEFAPVAVEARSDAKPVRVQKIVVRTTKVRHARVERPHVPARTKLARRHTNPLDAQAMDTRIQRWPCKSGGICDWKR